MIIKTSKGAYYVNGLFAEVHKNLDIFNSNIYFSYLMVRSLMDEVDAHQFHKEAVDLGVMRIFWLKLKKIWLTLTGLSKKRAC